jgi:hypothetical protein
VLSERRNKKTGIPVAFYDEHGLDLQRAYSIICLMVGAEPGKYATLAREAKIPAERQSTCRFDYGNASWSWEQLLKPYGRKPEDPRIEIAVNYVPTTRFAALATLARNLQILEAQAAWLSQDFSWRRPITFEMRECGEPGARWELAAKKVVVCYEIIEDFFQLHRHYGQLKPLPALPRANPQRKRAKPVR